jgi:ABC-type multidrug transport system fused ATPase/permease subunit
MPPMQTFSDVLKALPVAETGQTIWVRRLFIGLIFCVIMFVILMALGWYLSSPFLIFAGYIPIALAVVCWVGQIALEMRDLHKMTTGAAGWIGSRLDKRYEEERVIAASLAESHLSKLKSMTVRIDAEVLTQEKWLEVIKPFSILVPAVLIIATSKYFDLPAGVQNFAQLAGAALIAGLGLGAISIYSALVKLRRVSSALHRAIAIVEVRKTVRFRKVSRRRGSNC